MFDRTIPKSLKNFIEDELYEKIDKSPQKYHKRSASKNIDSLDGNYYNNQILKVDKLKCTSSYTISLDILQENKNSPSLIKKESKKLLDFFQINKTHNNSISYSNHENGIIQNIPNDKECDSINQNVLLLK